MRNEKRPRLEVLFCAVAFCAAVISPAARAQKSKQEEPKTQQQLVREVRHQLVMLPYYSVFDNLAYGVEGDKVILEGQVVRPSLKTDAEAAVKGVEGVSSIVNNIEILPPSPMDDQLRRALYRSITLGGSVEGLRIVTSGLQSGDRVVVNGLQRVGPGALLKSEVAEMGEHGAQRASADDNQRVAQR